MPPSEWDSFSSPVNTERAMETFKRPAGTTPAEREQGASEIRKTTADILTAPVTAADSIMREYKPGSGEFSDKNVHDALVAGPGTLGLGLGRAAGAGGAELGAMGGSRMPIPPEKKQMLVELATADLHRPAKEILREFRAKHGEGGMSDPSVISLISKIRENPKAIQREAYAKEHSLNSEGAKDVLSLSNVEQMIAQEYMAGGWPSDIATTVRKALGMAAKDPNVTRKTVEAKIKELMNRGVIRASGVPIPGQAPGAAGEPEAPTGAGRFAQPKVQPAADRGLADEARALTGRVSQAADEATEMMGWEPTVEPAAAP